MRAYLIDAALRKVIEFDLNYSLDGIEELLGLDYRGGFTVGSGPLNGPNDDPDADHDHLYVRDVFAQYFTRDYRPSALREKNRPSIKGDPKHWFQLDAHLDEPATFPIPNRGLVVGVNYDGEWVDAAISLKELTERVTFTRRKLRGITTRSTIIRGETWIGPMAPVIEEK